MKLLIGALILLTSIAHASDVELSAPAINLHIETSKVAHIEGSITPATVFTYEVETMNTFQIPGERVIIINSGGGMVDAGEQIIDRMETEKAQGVKLICVVKHEASSMAFNILTHCDIRLSAPDAHMTVHKIEQDHNYMVENAGRLTAQHLRQIAHDLDVEDEPFRRANSKAMHLNLGDYDMFADNETCWTAKNLLKRHYLHAFATLNEY